MSNEQPMSIRFCVMLFGIMMVMSSGMAIIAVYQNELRYLISYLVTIDWRPIWIMILGIGLIMFAWGFGGDE